MAPLPRGRCRERGFSLIEILVGLAIGMVAMLVVYQVFAVSEGYKRTTTAGVEALTAGVVSSFIVAEDLNSAGSTLAASAVDLAKCRDTGDFATTLRPIPLLITDGGAPDASDSVDVYYGVAPILVTSVELRNNAPPGTTFRVQSPMGFAKNDLFVVGNDAGVCETARVSNDPKTTLDANGVVTIEHSSVANTYPASTSFLVNLGPDPNGPSTFNPVRKIRYSVSANGAFQSRDLLTEGATNTPIASNVMLFKAQYGLDTDGDRYIDTWQSATGAWNPAGVLAAPLNQLRQIKAIRFAMVVRSTQFERTKEIETGAEVAPQLASDFQATLFDCYGIGAPACTGELANVTLPNSAHFRHRVFEQVVPLRSMIWNP